MNISAVMMEFLDFIEANELIDLLLVGARFTSCNTWENPSISKIDGFLISPDWEDKFISVFWLVLPRSISDPLPTLLDCGNIHSGKGPFRFGKMWLKEGGSWREWTLGGDVVL